MKNPERVAELLAELRGLAENDFEQHRLDVLERDLTSPPQVEIIDDTHQRFNGFIYRQDRYGHYAAGHSVHRDIWQYYYGEIPKGFAVHHINEDKNDNNIENLQLMSSSEHSRIHNSGVCRKPKKIFVCECCGKEYEAHDCKRNRFCSEACAKRYCREHPTLQKTCDYCGKEFTAYKRKIRFCSSRCATLARFVDRHEERTCPVCGKIFDVLKRSKKIYCSRKCYGKAHTKKFSRICVICGKKFETIPSENCRTCSPECGHKLQSQTRSKHSAELTRICPICGKEFMTYPSNPRKTCSKECWRKLAVQNRRSK